MRSVRETYDAIRRPEFTGENRCLPCTVVNVGIALGVAAAVGVVATPLAAGAVFAVGVLAVALRGYLIPGTPALTRRYLPDRVLARFDHRAADETDAGVGDVDAGEELLTAGALTERAGDDFRLDPSFRDQWFSRIEALDGDEARRDAVRRYGDIEAGDDVAFDPMGPAFTVLVNGREWGEYPSETAFVAEAAAADVLAERHPEWSAFPLEARGELLAGLRLFLDRCPACGGAATVGETAVESCCREGTVVAVTCDDCGARLFEVTQFGESTPV